MNIPAKAIITAKTKYEADRLLDFLQSNGCQWLESDNKWGRYESETCYNIEADKRIMFCDRDFYQTEIDRMDAGEPDPYGVYSFVPEDTALRFISTDAFIALCCGYDSNAEDTDVDISTLI